MVCYLTALIKMMTPNMNYKLIIDTQIIIVKLSVFKTFYSILKLYCTIHISENFIFFNFYYLMSHQALGWIIQL